MIAEKQKELDGLREEVELRNLKLDDVLQKIIRMQAEEQSLQLRQRDIEAVLDNKRKELSKLELMKK